MADESPTRTSTDGDGLEAFLLAAPLGRIGPYTLLRPIGEGGMGIVYLAHQKTPVERRVALKLIKQGMGTREVIARFDAERQALAVMNHPGIARVFDGGITDDGRPFFVMEFVDGEPITEFCDRLRLPLDQRVALVTSVCRAVQHAHQKGVIHRDLKPSNVLVTHEDGKPAPKVIDFGIAKAVSEPLTDRTFATEAGQWVGTPAYMSPEQLGLTALDIDTRSDIYSLGIVLYELLAGVRPYEDRKVPHRHGVIEEMRDNDAPPPATRLRALKPDVQQAIAAARQTPVASLRRQLGTDLGWIVVKAIEKERTRRYETVNSLAADLQRYLANEPVIARPPSTSYRTRKFVSRHRVGVAAAAVIAALLLTSSAIIAAQATRVAAERDRATLAAARATSINAFLREMLASANPWGEGSRQMTVVDALAGAERRIDASLADQPDVAVGVKRTIADGYLGLGEFARAERLLNSAVETTRAHPERRAELVETLALLGGVYRQAGRLDDAAKVQSEGLSLSHQLGEERRDLVAALQQGLAETRREQGRLEEATTLASDAVTLTLDVHGPASPESARTYDTLANVVNLAGDSARAESLLRQAVDIRRQVRGARHPEVGLSLSNLGATLLQRGDFEAAVKTFAEAVEILRESLGEMHPALAVANENMSNGLMRLNRLDESASRLEEVLRVRRAMLGDDSMAVARTLHNIGVVYTRAGMLDKADASLAEAQVRLERSLGRDHPEIATVVRNRGGVLERRGDLRGAETLYRDALARNVRQLGENNAATATAAAVLAKVLQVQRRYDEAETELLRAQTIRTQVLGAAAPLTTRTSDDLAKLYDAWGRPERAAAVRATLPK
jgi:non-specific serine/threonine protein kinase/serine/threonine-protein kinase